MNALNSLRGMLAAAVEAGARRTESWTDDAQMAHLVKRVTARHGGLGAPPNPATIALAVARFRATGEPEGWRGLKGVCFGAGSPDEKGWCVLSDATLRNRLLTLAQGQAEARKRVLCFRWLLSCYLGFRLSWADQVSHDGWLKLREWLDHRMQSVSRDIPTPKDWFKTLEDNHNLLRDDPCGIYGSRLLAGNGTALQSVVVGLGIPSDSWVHEEAIMAQMRAGAALNHEMFRTSLPSLLSVATGTAGVSVSKSLQRKCVALLVRRYAKMPGTSEHPALRDAAISAIGSPWLMRPAWDASVIDDRGRPDDAAREMVNGWLKRRLITDFFELLSADGTGDRRRLDYWLRFEPLVDDMWFALGSETRQRKSEAFRDFRSRAYGRLLELDGTTADNNAFVMRMGELLAVEFGAKGNAFFLFRWDDLPKGVKDKLLSGKEYVSVEISALRSTPAKKRLIHMDSPGKSLSWEQKFDQVICPAIGSRPNTPPKSLWGSVSRAQSDVQRASQLQTGRNQRAMTTARAGAVREDIRTFVASWGLRIEDNRPKGGALWVITDDSRAAVRTTLKNWGFRYKPGKGWWKE